MKFYIEEQNISTATFEVDADNEEQAYDLHNDGESVLIDEYDDTSIDVWEAVD